MKKKTMSRGNRTVKDFEFFTLYSTVLGEDQAYISASVTNFTVESAMLTECMYTELARQLVQGGYHIIHERIFGSLQDQNQIMKARADVLKSFGLDPESPATFIQGHPVKGHGLAGVQLRAFKPSSENKIWTIYEDKHAVGKGWERNGASFRIVQNMYGDINSSDRYHESCDMFDRTQKLLQQDGMGFRNVLRTWIYLSKILDWYGEFNRARNARFTEYGILGLSEKENTEAEQIYLPASTGILGENPQGAASVMDVFAVDPNSKNIEISHTAGVQQMSPYRYGSAFSRAMTLKESDVTHILLSGTASIDEHGKTVHINDMRGQIRKTFQVVEALIEQEGATLADINEATVFLKDKTDLELYWEIAEEFGVADLPAILLVADVCRADLLFEIDAAIAY